MHTMTHQSVLQGIPAVQLEIPRSVRALLITDDALVGRFADAILSTYHEVVVPFWERKRTNLFFNLSLSRQIVEARLNGGELEQVYEEYREWDTACPDMMI